MNKMLNLHCATTKIYNNFIPWCITFKDYKSDRQYYKLYVQVNEQ